MSQVLESCDFYEGAAVGNERCLHSRLCFLCCQLAAFPLLLLSTEVYGGGTDVEGLLCNEHVTIGTYEVGMIEILQDNNFVPHVAVCKMNPEVGPVCRSSQTPLNWDLNYCQHYGEIYLIFMGLPGLGVGVGCDRIHDSICNKSYV